jgi:hypothetical protein
VQQFILRTNLLQKIEKKSFTPVTNFHMFENQGSKFLVVRSSMMTKNDYGRPEFVTKLSEWRPEILKIVYILVNLIELCRKGYLYIPVCLHDITEMLKVALKHHKLKPIPFHKLRTTLKNIWIMFYKVVWYHVYLETRIIL